MKLSHLLADDIRAEREIEIARRQRQNGRGLAQAPITSRPVRPATLFHRLLAAR